MAKTKETSKKILMYLREHQGENMTSTDVAEAVNLGRASVDASFTFCLQKNNWGYREEGTREDNDGNPTKVKFLRLTELGMTADIDNS